MTAKARKRNIAGGDLRMDTMRCTKCRMVASKEVGNAQRPPTVI
jgi:hypothetical protein